MSSESLCVANSLQSSKHYYGVGRHTKNSPGGYFGQSESKNPHFYTGHYREKNGDFFTQHGFFSFTPETSFPDFGDFGPCKGQTD